MPCAINRFYERIRHGSAAAIADASPTDGPLPDSHYVLVAPCTSRGRPTGPPIEATARVTGPDDDAAERALDAKYGLQRRFYERVAPYGKLVHVEVSSASPPVAGPTPHG